MKNRQKIGRKSGGIILGYKDPLENYIEPLETESSYIIWFKVSSKLFNLNDDLIFGIVYIPPEGSSYLSTDAFDQVENEYRVLSQNYKYICLLVDFIDILYILMQCDVFVLSDLIGYYYT